MSTIIGMMKIGHKLMALQLTNVITFSFVDYYVSLLDLNFLLSKSIGCDHIDFIDRRH